MNIKYTLLNERNQSEMAINSIFPTKYILWKAKRISDCQEMREKKAELGDVQGCETIM